MQHRDTFAIAFPLEPAEPAQFNSSLASALKELAPPTSLREGPEEAGAEAALAASAAPPPESTDIPSAVDAPLVTDSPPSCAACDLNRLVQPNDRVAFFVDGANMDGAARSAGYFVDYWKVREHFLGAGVFYAAYYYVADFTASDPLQQRFLDRLSHIGYIIRKRPVKVIHDEDTGERIIKGNLDTEIVLDMLNTVDNYDVAFLLSGDSDFERAVELLRSRGKRVYVLTSRRSCSRELGYVADKPIFFLEDLRDRLARAPRAAAT